MVKSQDLHFSNSENAPLLLNAAETGMFEGDWRVAANYRQQWKSLGKPFQTIAASFDQQIYALPGNFSAGALVINDQSGSLDLINNRVYLNLGYVHRIGLWNFSVGLQPGFVNKSYNLSDITFPEQYNPNIGMFDPLLPISEVNPGNHKNYFDMNAGLLAERKLDSGLIRLGFSLQHINAPDVSFLDDKENLMQRYNTYVQGFWDLKNELFVRPVFLVSTLQKAQEVVVGGDVGFYTSRKGNVKEISLGIKMRNGFNRNGDAYIASIGAHVGNFKAALAYDVNYSNLKYATNNQGALEFSIIYTSPSSAVKHITIPCDRY